MYKQRKRKCYKCGRRGHIAANCNKICKKCGDIIDHKICFKQIVEAVDMIRELPMYINKNKYHKLEVDQQIKIIRDSMEFLRKGEEKVKLEYKRQAEEFMPAMQIRNNVAKEVNEVAEKKNKSIFSLFTKMSEADKATLFDTKYAEARLKYIRDTTEAMYEKSSFKKFLNLVVPTAYLNKMVSDLEAQYKTLFLEVNKHTLQTFPQLEIEEEPKKQLKKMQKYYEDQIKQLQKRKLPSNWSKEREDIFLYARKVGSIVKYNECVKLEKLYKKYVYKHIKKDNAEIKEVHIYKNRMSALAQLLIRIDKSMGNSVTFKQLKKNNINKAIVSKVPQHIAPSIRLTIEQNVTMSSQNLANKIGWSTNRVESYRSTGRYMQEVRRREQERKYDEFEKKYEEEARKRREAKGLGKYASAWDEYVYDNKKK